MNTPAPSALNPIAHTWLWIDKVIIGENFCPFAKKERVNDTIKMVSIDSKKTKVILGSLMKECEHLDKNAATETTIIVLENALKDFYEYLDVLDIANQLLADEGYEGIYQIASFHPDYVFADDAEEDASNYTNRSPYPMFHLLRESSLAKAIESFPDTEGIPVRNIQRARELGVEWFREHLV